MPCKGICVQFKSNKPIHGGRYKSGQKRCQVCEIYIMVDGLCCPCCGYRLRTRPRNRIYKDRLRERQLEEKMNP